jgi:D-glycero-D-manno-heptose 1,7-bisphosphate phosphatase
VIEMQVKTVFIDRDGVINLDSPDFIKTWDDFEFIQGSLSAIRLLHESGRRIIVVSNQSGVGRGLITPAALADIHRRMQVRVTAAGGKLTDILFCPHLPDAGCSCRKPNTGLIQLALSRYPIALKDAALVGDSLRDIRCAQQAGCRYAVLVRTGNGVAAQQELVEIGHPPHHVADDLLQAAHWIMAR